MWTYVNRNYHNCSTTLTLSANHSQQPSINVYYSLKLETETVEPSGDTSAYSNVEFRLNKVETVELLKSLIECDLDKVQDEPNKPKVHVPVFSVGRQGIKYLVKFVRNNYEKIERNESENKGNATEYIGWDFKIAMYTDEMIG